MAAIFEKLNLKNENTILVVNAPQSFEQQLTLLPGVQIQRDVASSDVVHFALVFVIKQKDLDNISAVLASKAHGDALLWFAYPKGSSKKYKCEFNRDTGWHILNNAGFHAVRQVSIDDDWSALRFRRKEFIKSRKSG
jgi:hypothetical protein